MDMEKLKALSERKPQDFASRIREITLKYRFNEQQLKIFELACIYQKYRNKAFKVIYSFPFKLSCDPKKQKIWHTFSNMYDTLLDNKINIHEYFPYMFKKFKSSRTAISPWFIFSERNILTFLKEQKDLRKSGLLNTAEKTSEQLLKDKFKICNETIKKVMSTRKCTLKQFWEDIWVGDLIHTFPIEYLRRSKTYCELYKSGHYAEMNLPNPFKNF